VNARLQVEHPVTEAVTGIDLVRWQLLVAQGEPLPLAQDEIRLEGHAVEARLCAEDPARDFLPATGRLALWQPPREAGLRTDAGVEAGSEVSVHYDSLLAKLIAHAPTREEAIRRLARGLRRLAVAGVATNRDFLVAALEHPAFAAGTLDTGFVVRHFPPEARRAPRDPASERLRAIAAALHAHEQRRRTAPGPLPPSIPSGWRSQRWSPQEVRYRGEEAEVAVRYAARAGGRFELEVEGERSEVRVVSADHGSITLEADGLLRTFQIACSGERVFVHDPAGRGPAASEWLEVPRFPRRAGAAAGGGCVAPMPGVVRQVNVAPGDRVEAGAVLLVLEAMKMEHPLVAAVAGVVAQVRVEAGQMVEHDAVLVVIE
jgi:propionyl-CoA carboxylase alpha chain